MAKRLAERYRRGERVEISFQGNDEWWPATVLKPAHPGLWVQTDDGRSWFVTNARRIRKASGEDHGMRPEVVQQLLALNQTFYDTLAQPFAQSRQRPQPGFSRLLHELPSPCRHLLDVGCGDGRFGRFLHAHHPRISYTGVDFSTRLLAIAQANTKGNFYQRDISQPHCLAGLDHFDAIVCLAALHHIPGRANRLRLLQEMKAHLLPHGRLMLSSWQFLDSERQRRKITGWQDIGLTAADVESHDYLLTWQRDGFALRYVCAIDEEETAVLAQEAGLQILAQFRSDGKEGNLGLYTVMGINRVIQ